VIIRIDVRSKAINDGLSRTTKAPLCLVVGTIFVVVVGAAVVDPVADVDVGNDDGEV